MMLRTGFTTGTAAAAAAAAAAAVLCGEKAPGEVMVALPGGAAIRIPIASAGVLGDGATAAVCKDAGDDPDVTNGLLVVATLTWADVGDIAFVAGKGVGTITKPGLQIPPGEPAINPVPRRMIREAIRQVTRRPVRVEISIPGGREVAGRTYNPRLGIEGGLSILGTTGIVRPYCTKALHDALKCALDVARATGVVAPVLVPGNIGARAAGARFRLSEQQIIEVGNEWGFICDALPPYCFRAMLVAGHPGKLAKLAAGDWDTHSSRSQSPVAFVSELFGEVFGRPASSLPTVQGIFESLGEAERARLGDILAARVRLAVGRRIGSAGEVAVFLCDMQCNGIGSDGDFRPWQ